MKIRECSYVLIFSDGRISYNKRFFFGNENFLFIEKDNNNFFLNRRKKEKYKKVSSYFSNYKNKYVVNK